MPVVMARALVGGLLIGSLLGGCGGDGMGYQGAAETTAPTLAPADGSSTDDGASDDGSADGGSTDDVVTDIPEHFPLEVAPGGQIQGVFEPTEGTLQDFWMIRVVYPEDDAEDVVAFYDDLLAERGFLEQKLASRADRVRWMTTVDSGIVTMKVDTGITAFPDVAVLEISWNEL